MAKKEQKPAPSWEDFSEDNLMGVLSTEEQEEETSEEEEEQEEDEKTKKKKTKAAKDEESEEEEQESEEEIEEVEEKASVKDKKKVSKEESEEETQEEETEEEEPEDDPQKFFEEVEKLTGQELDVDYGDIDPLTPQGIAIREKAVRESAVDGFLEEIETKFPVAFKALKHAYNGGDIAELFKTTTARDYTKVELTDKDQPLAKEILREYYQNKGIKNTKKIDAFIQTAEDSEEGLIAEAKSALEELKTEQTEKADAAIQSQQTKAADSIKKDKIMVSAVDEILETGKLGNFKLTGKQEATEFRTFVIKNLRRSKTEDGKYEFSSLVDNANLEKLLQYQYFQYKKGDLGKLIQIKAATEQATKLKLRLKAESSSKKRGSGTEAASSDKQPSLQDYIV